MKKLAVFFVLGLLIFACKKESKKPIETTKSFEKIKQLQWLVGNWSNITDEEQSYENWTQTNDSTLIAHSFTLVDNDTVFAERVTLQQKSKNVLFTVVAYHQNDNQPVTFKMIPSEKKVFTFENPQHDFPKRISYSNPEKDSIHAWIEGKVKGDERKVDFYYNRAH